MPSWDRNSFDRSSDPDKKNNGHDAAASGGLGTSGPDMQQSAMGSTPSSGNSTASGNPTQPIPSLQLPKAGGAIRGIDEKFRVNAANGTSSCSIPLPFSPSRMGFAPQLGLSYSSGSGNGPFGLGWQLSLPSITRRTHNCLPKYEDADESDTFQLAGMEDLIPVLTQSGKNWIRQPDTRTVGGVVYSIMPYRPRIDQAFARIERWTDQASGETHWRVISAGNSTSYFGLSSSSRIADPQEPNRVFEWLLCQTQDDKGNISLLNYKTEDRAGVPLSLSEKNRSGMCAQTYLSSVWYGNTKPWYAGDPLPAGDQFIFRAIFDYGEHDPSTPIPATIYQETSPWVCRKDPFSSFRAGFDIRTYRRCSRVLMFHCLPGGELPVNPYLVRSLDLQYDDDLSLLGNGGKISGFSFLVKATLNGHIWDAGSHTYTTRATPAMEFRYQQNEWNTLVQDITAENLAGSPSGVDGNNYFWTDLFGEGIAGILTEQSDAWYYKANLGGGAFTPALALDPIPSFRGLGNGALSVRELEGDGTKYLVQESAAPQGFFKLSASSSGSPGNPNWPGEPDGPGYGGAGGAGDPGAAGGWQRMRFFGNYPTIDPGDTNARRLDLNEDGREDILYTEDYQFRWYESLGEQGFRVAGTTPKAFDEEKGPAIVFADTGQSIFLADMSGDGLVDIVRIRNGEICYWPNLGYGRFGAKIGMDKAPLFDTSDGFDPSLIRLADIDGSGTTDIVYLGRNSFRVWMNLNGNAWSDAPQIINPFPGIDDTTAIDVLDFLGTGTACIVCSSSWSKQPMRYIDLMGSRKPALMIAYLNNCGKETTLSYKSSTAYYLADKQAGIPWITKLPFPVICVAKVTLTDKIRETVFTNTYNYRHGYFDPYDKEFRGFARVEQYDTESFEAFVLNMAKNVVEQDIHQPPVKTVSWFHTGAFLSDGESAVPPGRQLTEMLMLEYFKNTAFAEYAIPDTVMPGGMDPDDLHEAFRACKGTGLRSEVYSNDGSPSQHLPYSASQANANVIMLQPKGPNRYACFRTQSSEGISYGYERNPADPRISHSFVLATDQYGNITQSSSVIYPRAARPAGPAAIPDTVWNQQNQLLIYMQQTDYTNDIIQPDSYRLRMPCETRAYDCSGISRPGGFYFTRDAIAAAIAGTATIPYEQDFSGAPEKRLDRHGRMLLAKDDLSGPLPLGTLSALGIPYRQYALAYTAGLVTKLYGTKVTGAMLTAAMYVHSEGDADWWTQSGLALYSATPASDFYIPNGSQDLFGNISRVQYDPYFQLVISLTDALSNTTSAVNDYRTCSPSVLTDANLNRNAVQTDELGMPIAMAVMGKEGSADGDTLADPTVRMEYDLLNWQNNGQPNYAHMFARTLHGPANTTWLESYIYSDGCGSVIMTKKQTPAGMAAQWNPVTRQADQVFADPRWIGNGRTILNNKGNVIKQYEPFFSANNGYETEDQLVQTGATSIRYYDAPGRLIRTDQPNGTFTKMEFDAWQTRIYDPNDTVKDSPWYQGLGSPDPTGPEPGDPDERAAWLAAKDSDTPTIRHTDCLGRGFYTIADYGGGLTANTYALIDFAGRYSESYDQLNRLVARSYTDMMGGSVYSYTAEKGETWSFNDVMGRMVNVWDNDISVFSASYDSLNRPINSYVQQGAIKTLISLTVYGELFPLATGQTMNLRGRAYQVYDQSGVMTTNSIDFKGNPLGAVRQLCKDYKDLIDWTPLNGLTDIPSIQAAAVPLLDTEVFHSSLSVDALNRPVTAILPDASVFTPVYDVDNLASLSVNIMGAPSATQFLAGQEYDAKGQRLNVRYGNDTTIRYGYDPETFRLVNLTTLQHPADPLGQAIQELNYHYDPVGNITEIDDAAQQTWFFRNSVVGPGNKFTYDALYQLISATGREHAGLGMDGQRDNTDIPVLQPIPEINDIGAVRNYTENYTYDLCGNLLGLQHLATGATWTQRYQYQYQLNPADRTNRLNATSMPGDGPGVFSGKYVYNGSQDHGLHGNMTSMPSLSAAGSLLWNFMDQLSSVNLGGGGMAYYVYGSDGGRVRKVIERQGGKIIERINIGAVEIYRERQGSSAPILERYTLHIADAMGRFARVDTKTIDTAGSDPGNPTGAPNIRYQYANHLGSALLETDQNGNIVSYEEYHPFGSSSYRVCQTGDDSSQKRYRYSGKEKDDETGLYYFGARYYAAWLGRWTSSDPAGFVNGSNLYRYCSNNPVMLHDPNGMDDKDIRWPIKDDVGNDIGYWGGPDHGLHMYPKPATASPSKPKAQNPTSQKKASPQHTSPAPSNKTPAKTPASPQANSADTTPAPQPAPPPPPPNPTPAPGNGSGGSGPAIPIRPPGTLPEGLTPGAPIPKIDLPQAPPGTDFEAAEAAGRIRIRGLVPFADGEQAQHWLKWRNGRNVNLDPDITNDPAYMGPLQSRRNLSNGPYTTPDGRSYNTPHTFADRGMYPLHEDEARDSLGDYLTDRSIHVEAGRRTMNDLTGSKGPTPPYIWWPTAVGVGGNFALMATRNFVPFVGEAEAGFTAGSIYATMNGYFGVAGALEAGAAYTPIVGGSLVAGAIAGNFAESAVTQATNGNKDAGLAAGIIASAAVGAGVGALIGSVVPLAGNVVGAGVGAAIGAVAGLGGYLISKYW